MKDNLTWILVGLVAGFLAAFLIFGKTPDIKTVVETKVITKQVQVVKNTVTEKETIRYKDGTVVEKEKIVNRDVIKEKEVVKDKIVDKTINYCGSIALGVNPFNTSEFCTSVQYDFFKPFFAEAVIRSKFINGEYSGYLLVGMRF